MFMGYFQCVTQGRDFLAIFVFGKILQEAHGGSSFFFFFQHTYVTTPQVDGAQEINNVAILGSQWKSLCKRMENAKFPGKVVSVNVDSYNREMF